ncbi:MarR family winged helix-turn-helix transcriptional regulator [Actinomadura rugatobispora]
MGSDAEPADGAGDARDPVADAYEQWVAHGWADAAPGMSAVTSLIRAHRMVLALIDEQIRDLDLTFARYEILVLLYFARSGRLSISTICTQLEVHQTTASAVVTRLEQQGFVTRERNPDDGRSWLILLTDEGSRAVLTATARLNSTVFSRDLFPAEQVNDLRMLRRSAVADRRRPGG